MNILNPVSPRRQAVIAPAPRLPNLDGALIGLLHTGKPGGSEVLEGLKRAISARYKDVQFEYRRKPHASTGATFIPSLLEKWDAAFVAIGD